MDIGEAERGRDESDVRSGSLSVGGGEGKPGEDIVDRGMSRGNVSMGERRTSAGERSLFVPRASWDCDDRRALRVWLAPVRVKAVRPDGSGE
jgi:hypothetical protein